MPVAHPWLRSLPLLAMAGLAGCQQSGQDDLQGSWRAVLASPGGELPFHLKIEEKNGALHAVAINGDDAAPITAIDLRDDQVIFRFDHYDAEITSRRLGRDRLEGRWRRTGAASDATLPFVAERVTGEPARFLPSPRRGAALESVEGAWSVEFREGESVEPARGELRQQGARVLGTFLTPTGDYRFLEGSFENGVLRLSTFDGSHAFLFEALARDDGSLAGDFWSRDSYHATWTARPAAAASTLPDPWTQVTLKNPDGRLRFAFGDLDGKTVASTDPRFDGKVVIVNLFGSWCPNCNDEAPLLAAWHRRFHGQGLEIVGLAYEFTGLLERDRRQVGRFAARHAIDYPLLLAGTSDKKKASATLPDLSGVTAFPTTVFVGRDGKVRKIHAGFAGPGTGRHHAELVREMEDLIAALLAES